MLKQTHIWLPAYMVNGIKTGLKGGAPSPRHIFFCMADHYEPYWGKARPEVALKRVETWVEGYPRIAERHQDAEGRSPKCTFFYPEEEYDPALLDKLAGLCRAGWGEVEIHLHHDQDTSLGMTAKLNGFRETLSKKHGLLPKDAKTGETKYAFIHGNWALDNSRKDGRWCGVNDEIDILLKTGCYVDMTLPSAPSDTQTRKINSIYYAVDDPDRPKSHDTGVDACVGRVNETDLLMIQGPLTLNWRRRKWGIFPRIESGGLVADNPITPLRISLWVAQGIHVVGRPEWVFIKVYGHGCQEKHMAYLLSEGFEMLFSTLERHYNDGENFLLHYVTAREMFNLVKAAEAGESGPPQDFFDYRLIF